MEQHAVAAMRRTDRGYRRPMNEAKPFIFRLKFPTDCKIPPHWHPAIEHVTVISGTLNMGTGDVLDRSKTTPMKTGSVFIMQPSVHHSAGLRRTPSCKFTASGHGESPTSIRRTIP
jgi:quercetin dioxygenase-like cupin family protein